MLNVKNDRVDRSKVAKLERKPRNEGYLMFTDRG